MLDDAGTEPRVLFVDFGLCKRLAPELRQAIREAIYALLQKQPAAFVDRMEDLGMLAPGSRPEVIDDIDVLPTLLAATGLPLADALPGEPAPFVRVRRPPPVASYQDVPVQRVDTPASEVDETILEKLRTLGYVE